MKSSKRTSRERSAGEHVAVAEAGVEHRFDAIGPRSADADGVDGRSACMRAV